MDNEVSEERAGYVYNADNSRQNRRGKLLGFWILILLGMAGFYIWNRTGIVAWAIILVLVGILLASTIKIAHEWQRAVVLRLGRFYKVAGPGPFVRIPVIDHITCWIDQRMRTTFFAAEKTLTRDNVPVNVDAVMFWVVWDPEKAALEVGNYQEAVIWAAQTALRDIIGKTELSEMLAGRERLDEELQKMIDDRTEEWGVAVRSVEIRDVVIPKDLQDVMSREAQAERERRARTILAQAEREIADNFLMAASKYEKSDIAFRLRAMNLLYESIKDNGGLVVVPGGYDFEFNALAGLTTYDQLTGMKKKREKEQGQKDQLTSEAEDKKE